MQGGFNFFSFFCGVSQLSLPCPVADSLVLLFGAEHDSVLVFDSLVVLAVMLIEMDPFGPRLLDTYTYLLAVGFDLRLSATAKTSAQSFVMKTSSV
jgi:hypothetical protein